MKFILNTDVNVSQNPRDLLHQIYEQVLNPYIIKNPVTNLNDQITNQLFETKLDEFIRKSPIF